MADRRESSWCHSLDAADTVLSTITNASIQVNVAPRRMGAGATRPSYLSGQCELARRTIYAHSG
jgi:hypothetical protein